MKMPVLFVGHGSPMNAIEDNEFTRMWEVIGREIPKPKAILAVSAHWYTDGSRTSDDENPKLVYDMYGFPKALYEVEYPVKGSPELAESIRELVNHPVEIDNKWGIDHGTWSVLCKMYPEADIPVLQLSIDYNLPPEAHYKIGEKLKSLRAEGVLIFASGNIVHNLSLVNWNMEAEYPWAHEFDDYIKTKIEQGDFLAAVDYKSAGSCSEKAFYTPDHYYPLLYALGAAETGESVQVFNDKCVMGALSMTSYRIG